MSLGVFDEGAGGGGFPITAPLQRAGVNFIDQQGIWKVKGITAFTAYQDFLEGRLDKLQAYADFTTSIGVNTWRIFGMWGNTQFDARAYGSTYYTRLNNFVEWCNERGIYPWLTVFTDQVDGSPIRMSQGDQFLHMKQVQDALRSKPCLIECVNEDRKNGQIAPMFSDFGGLIGTRSWWDEDESYLQVGSLLSFTSGHPDRGLEWVRKTQQCIEISRFGYSYHSETEFAEPTGRPHVIGEPRRVAEGTTPRQHADAAAWSLLSGGGYVLHGGYAPAPGHESDLQRCNVPTGLALECCQGAGDVYRAPLSTVCAASGRFLHGNADDGGDCPVYHRDRYGNTINPAGSVRTYCLETPGRMDGLALDPGPQHPDTLNQPLPTRNGWTITERLGHKGNVFIARR